MNRSTVAIVTGASRGLGHALALGLMAPNVHLITIARGLSSALADAAQQASCTLQQVQADLSDARAIDAVVQPIMAALPEAERYVLINNAATVQPVGLAPSLTDAASISDAFTLNVGNIIALTAEFIQFTARSGAQRRIVNISSGAGRSPMPGWAVYCATKAALDMYSRVVQAESHDLRIVSLAPGVIDTHMQSSIRGSSATDFPNVARFQQMHEHGQLSSAHDTALAILTYIDSEHFGTEVLEDIRRHI